jgi:general secretion pathway protein J
LSRSSSARSRAEARAGFTLLEALLSLAIAAAILSGIAMVSAQVLRNWNHGSSTIAAMEMLTSGLARLGTDLSLALPVRPPGSENSKILFEGEERKIMFVAATGFGAGNRGVELLTVEVVPDGEGIALVRKRGAVASLATLQTDPVVLLRGRATVRFAYRDDEGVRTTVWAGKSKLPASVEVEILGASGMPIFPVAMVLPLPSRLAAECLEGEDEDEGDFCDASETGSGGENAADDDDDKDDRQGLLDVVPGRPAFAGHVDAEAARGT